MRAGDTYHGMCTQCKRHFDVGLTMSDDSCVGVITYCPFCGSQLLEKRLTGDRRTVPQAAKEGYDTLFAGE